MKYIKPVIEPCPSLPEPKNTRGSKPNYKAHELFGFDTETTRCGKKELRSCQFAYYKNADKTRLQAVVYSVVGWFTEGEEEAKNRVDVTVGEDVDLEWDYQEFDSVKDLRKACQKKYVQLMYKKNKIVRCGVAFNANFDLGVLANSTTLDPEMSVGGMEGAGCIYHFKDVKKNIKALFLGAFNVPFVTKRGQVWDISPLTKNLWGCNNLASTARYMGMNKLVDEGERSVTYAIMDSIITLDASIQLTEDLKEMGFTGNPDRFVSGATVAKDLMKRHYEPFYLDQEQHAFTWKAYFGGMTGSLDILSMREPLYDMVYGDLDGAYNASGQRLQVFKWDSVKWIDADKVLKIVEMVKKDPSLFWKYGSLHIEVAGDFDNVPVRVGSTSKNGTPSKSEGLVWAKVTNLKTTLTLGDYLHSKPKAHIVVRGLIIDTRNNESPCIFKMADDERKKYPKYDKKGDAIKENFVPNTWWKLCGNTAYGSFANRNGKHRESSGKWFNALIASSITGAIRHCMWTVNHSSEAVYNDTDSALTTVEGFEKAVEALKPLKIGFSNKTNDELPNCDVAKVAVVQGSKRYAMLSHDGKFGAKCHGLGSWHICLNGRRVSVAHNEEVLHNVWKFNYPDIFGEPNKDIMSMPVFHTFSVRTQKVSDMVKEYARRQWEIPLAEISAYGKAGNFGFLSPTIKKNQIIVKVSYEPKDASDISDLTLQDVACMWGSSYDKKFDYDNLERWKFDGEGFTLGKSATPRTADIDDGDISVHVME
tara:strand:+ start:9084 stop:11363 length:2280 start_codon:yes stop_codon:yes gene_type:complete